MDINIETKKNDLIQLILSIADESILDLIKVKIVKTIPQKDIEDFNDIIIGKYQTKIEKKLNLEDLKKKQNYISPSLAEVEKLIEEADIKEPIEELLKMI